MRTLSTDILILGSGGAGKLATSTYSLVQAAGEGFSVSREPVKFSRVRPGESLLPKQ